MKSYKINDNAREYLIAILFGVYGMYEMQQMATPECRAFINNLMDNELNYDESTELIRIQQLSMSHNQNIDTLLNQLVISTKSTKERIYCKEQICKLIDFGVDRWTDNDTKTFLHLLATITMQRLK